MDQINLGNKEISSVTKLIKLGKYHEALQGLKLLNKKFNHFLINWYLGHVYFKLHNYSEAENYIKKSINLKSEDTLNLNFLGEIYLEKNQYTNAIAAFEKSLKIDQENKPTILNLIKSNLNIGNIDECEKYLNFLLKKDPLNFSYHYSLIKINEKYLTKNLIDKVQDSSDKLDFNNKIYLNLILAKINEIKKNYSKEIKHLNIAHETYRVKIEKAFNQQYAYFTDILPKFVKKCQKIELNTNSKLHPIFIMGLPRSGTSLVERIITSGDNKIQSLGESDVFDKVIFANQIHNITETDNIKNFNEKVLAQYVQQGYLQENIKFTDKSISNFLQIEILYKIFPNAKFVYCYRNPTANLVGLLRSFLPNVFWSHSLKNVCVIFDQYFKKLSKITNEKLINLHVVELEKLSNNSEIVSKELFKYLELEWTPECIKTDNKNVISKTASNLQIRKPIQKHDLSYTADCKKIFKQMGLDYEWLI